MKFVFMLMLMVPVILAHPYTEEQTRKINLEDIEDDNLLSEKLAQENDPLITQSTQHLRPPSVLAINPYLAHQASSSEVVGGIVYATPASTNSAAIQYSRPDASHENEHQVQYVTQTPTEQYTHHQQQGYASSAGTQVHEHEPTYTYTTIANRHNLVNAITPTVAGYSQQQQQQQQPEQQPPQYVFVHQARHNHEPQAVQQVVGGIQYVTAQQASPIIYGRDNDENDDDDDQNHNDESDEKTGVDENVVYHHHHEQPQVPPGGGATYLQYVPYITRGPNDGQSYIMMAPIPAGYGQQAAKPILTYSPVGQSVSSHQHHHQQQQQQLVQYISHPGVNPLVGGIQYLTSNGIDDTVQPHSHPISIPYAPDYTSAILKHPSKYYSAPSSPSPPAAVQQHHHENQPNSAEPHDRQNYLPPYSVQVEKSQEKSYHEEDKSDGNKMIIYSHDQADGSDDEDFVPVKQQPAYSSSAKGQDIQYLPPKNAVTQTDKSNQQFYAPERHPLSSNKPSQVHSYSTSANRFSSFPSHQQSPLLKYWSPPHKVMPMTPAHQQSRKPQQLRYPVNIRPSSAISESYRSTTANPIKSPPPPSSAQAFRSPIPKFFGPTPKSYHTVATSPTFQSIVSHNIVHRPQQQQQQQRPPHPTVTPFHHNNPSVSVPKFHSTNSDPFSSGNRQPKSLLDSYIPSWVVVQNQHKERMQQHQNYAHKFMTNNNYNTISYSVPHNQIAPNTIKRSATTIPPPPSSLSSHPIKV